MAHVNTYPTYCQIYRLGKVRISRGVRISEDGLYRSDEAELVQNALPSNVARVKNQFYPAEGLVYRGSEKTVRIRDQSNRVRRGVCHDPSYILEVSCRGYDWR
jgi:hypothetical protein